MRGRFPTTLALVSAAALAATAVADATLHVSAAISLRDPLQELIRAFEHDHAATRVRANFDASSTLVRQALAGAPCDLFLSADRESLEPLIQAGRVRPADLAPFARGELVLIARLAVVGLHRLDDLADGRIGRIALCDESVPVGRAARAWLGRAGVWERLQARVVRVEHVRAALLAVENGAADAAIVYRTEAAGRRVRIVTAAGPDDAPPVIYWAAPLPGERAAEAAAFVAFLTGPRGRQALRTAGFQPAEPPPSRAEATPPSAEPAATGGPATARATSRPATQP